MAYTLTSDQLADMQSDLGISNDEAVFTDVELNRFYTRAEGDFEGAKVYALRRLVSQAQLFFDYTIGQTQEKRSQVFDNLMKMLDRQEELTGMSGQLTGNYIDLNNLFDDEYADSEEWSI